MPNTATTTKEQRTRVGILMLALTQAGADSFLVNVIQNWHSSPYRKLQGLLKLTRAGHKARTGQFDIDVLEIDGERQPWESLETWGHMA